jgi:hypothetical protein
MVLDTGIRSKGCFSKQKEGQNNCHAETIIQIGDTDA